MKRRTLIKSGIAALGLSSISPAIVGKELFFGGQEKVPSFLHNYRDVYAADPRSAALTFFKEAGFGLFLHYGLYSLLEGFYKGSHSRPAEWVQFRGKIRVGEYEKLAERFTAEQFDADKITDVALSAGMRYINITTRHHDSFCLFDSEFTDFKSTNSPAKRDLVAELAAQCDKKGIGLFLYYSHGRDWRHPHAPNNDHWGGAARPKYDPPDEHYRYGEEHDLNIYVDFMKNQITELLTKYGPIAGIWLDGIGTPLSNRPWIYKFKAQELYDHIHALQPHTLVSYKQGLLGTEDFKAPERDFKGTSDVPLEICDTLQPHSWGYDRSADTNHKGPAEVMKMLERAESISANLLLNTGPLPDGSLHPDDVRTLAETGKKLQQGIPDQESQKSADK